MVIGETIKYEVTGHVSELIELLDETSGINDDYELWGWVHDSLWSRLRSTLGFINQLR